MEDGVYKSRREPVSPSPSLASSEGQPCMTQDRNSNRKKDRILTNPPPRNSVVRFTQGYLSRALDTSFHLRSKFKKKL